MLGRYSSVLPKVIMPRKFAGLRHCHILSFFVDDTTRVVLEGRKEKESNYINANYITVSCNNILIFSTHILLNTFLMTIHFQ